MLGKNLIQAASGAAAAGGGLGIEDVFSTWLYTGNGSTQTITNGIDLAGAGGMVWIKNRDFNSGLSPVHDTERGIGQRLSTNLTDGQVAFNPFSSINPDGFTLNTSGTAYNNSSYDYASWTFRKAPGFFDVVTYTGDGVAGRTVAHNLGSVPGCIIVKRTDSTSAWTVYHVSTFNIQILQLNTDGVRITSDAFANTDPTASVFSVGNNVATNGVGATYVAYLFANDEQIFGEGGDQSVIKCGVYSGSATVDLGWEPQWLLIKPSAAAVDWYLFDTMRGWFVDSAPRTFYANKSNAELSGSANFKITSTGFIDNWLGYSDTIYIAIRRGPMKTPTDATEVFAADFDSASSTIPTWDSGFPVDMAFAFDTQGGAGAQKNSARLLSSNYLLTSTNNAAASDGSLVWDSNLGWGKGYDTNRDYVSWMFQRAPGFFDVVAYTGTGVARTVPHNLGVAPELMIVKSRSSVYDWYVYSSQLTATKFLLLNETNGAGTSSGIWNNTEPTSSEFTVGTYGNVNQSGSTYVAYLFATCPGVSKVGSYTGTGTTLSVDCGFTAGARFVMIKRTDSTGDWYVWDTARGIVSGNDPYLLLNSTAAEVTSTDYIDPLSSGFQISSTAPSNINASGASFIFLAIA